jgi:exodeoxyribonuclease VII large subunit
MRLRNGAQRLEQLHARLWRQRPLAALARRRDQLDRLRRNLRSHISASTLQRAARLDALNRALHAVSPLATLQRGYTILLDADSGRVVRSVNEARLVQRFNARFADGELPLRHDKGN